MKLFLGIDRTTDKKNETVNGSEFITKHSSPALYNALEQAQDNTEKLLERAKLPLAVRVIGWICVVAALALVGGIFSAWNDDESMSIPAMYAAAPWLFWCAGAAVIGAITFGIVTYRFFKKTVESDEGDITFSALDNASDSIFADLGVPPNAVEVDLLAAPYKIKNGEPVHYDPFSPTRFYTTLIFRAYREGDALCLTNAEGVHTFPLSEMREIQTVRKSIITDTWNKEEAHNKGIYKPYKIHETEDGFSSKPYHVLTLVHNGEEWGIYFPCYELPTLETLTGLTAEA